MAISSPEMIFVPDKSEYVMLTNFRRVLLCLLTEVDVTKRSTSDLAANPVFIADTEILRETQSVRRFGCVRVGRESESAIAE